MDIITFSADCIIKVAMEKCTVDGVHGGTCQ